MFIFENLEKLHDCHVNATCVNIYGSFICECPDGHVGNGRDCIDMRCPDCGENAHCTVNSTSFTLQCECDPGYDGDPYHNCTDIDECFTKDFNFTVLHNCNETYWNETCRNTVGSFECLCPDGYDRNNITGLCEEDQNECSLGNHNCHQNATCSNTDGSFTCDCILPTIGNGEYCVEIKCPVCGPNAHCTWNGTDTTCVCAYGFEGDDPYDECIDINECDPNATLAHNCDKNTQEKI